MRKKSTYSKLKKGEKSESPLHNNIKVIKKDGTRVGLEGDGIGARVAQSVMEKYEDTPLTNMDSMNKRSSIKLQTSPGSVDATHYQNSVNARLTK